MMINRRPAKPIGNAFVDLQHRDGLPRRTTELFAEIAAGRIELTSIRVSEDETKVQYEFTINAESTEGNSDGEVEQRQPC
jgi:hypothetical protein